MTELYAYKPDFLYAYSIDFVHSKADIGTLKSEMTKPLPVSSVILFQNMPDIPVVFGAAEGQHFFDIITHLRVE